MRSLLLPLGSLDDSRALLSSQLGPHWQKPLGREAEWKMPGCQTYSCPNTSRSCLREGVRVVRKSTLVSPAVHVLLPGENTANPVSFQDLAHTTLDSHRAALRGPVCWCLMCDQSPPNVTWGMDLKGMFLRIQRSYWQVILLFFFLYNMFIEIEFICCNSSHPFRVHSSVVL